MNQITKMISIIFLIIVNIYGQTKDPVDYVNTLIGSDGTHVTEYGGMQPGVTTPFGMTQWVPMTRINKISRCSYHYQDKYIGGFIGTHQPAVWMGDYGQISIMPGLGEISTDFVERKLAYNHDNEIATPFYYSVQLEETDEKNWKNIDRVENNSKSITDRNIKSIESKRIRLYVKDPENSNQPYKATRIYEIELYNNGKKIDILKSGKISASDYVYEGEKPEFAFDNNIKTKWCASGKGNWLEINFNESIKIDRWVVKHAEIGGEDKNYNTKSFSLQYYQKPVIKEEPKKIKTEFTATCRSSLMKFSFPKNEQPYFIIDASVADDESALGWIKINKEKNEITGWNSDMHSAHLGVVVPEFKGYFVIQFNKSFEEFGCYFNDKILPNKKENTADHTGGFVRFTKNTKSVKLRIGTSFISIEQAKENLHKEINTWNLNKIKKQTKNEWNEQLSRIIVESQDENAKAIFYSAMYHAHLYPRTFSEYGRYFSAFDQKVHNGVSYNDYSLWDTFRGLHPLLTITAPEHVGPMITSLLQMYKQGGWLPKWPNPGYTGIMIGSHSESVIADAYVKGLRDFDVELAYEACYKSSMIPQKNDTTRDWADRAKNGNLPETLAGLTYYKKLGYVPVDKIKESVSRTLEFAYDDFCIAQLAKGMNKTNDYNYFINRSKNYKNVYKDNFVNTRNSKGEWVKSNKWVGFTEGNPWTYQFCVLQDFPGLIDLMDGKGKFIEILDKNFNDNHYRHDNEPGHHYPYLYNYCGMPWKTQKLVREIMHKHYKNDPKGYSGNEDCGQMSAWYILSSMGFYSVTPGSGEYAIGSPIWDKMTINFGKPYKKSKLKIICKNQSAKNIYIQSVTLNGKSIKKPFLKHSDLIKGGKLVFLMGNKPNKNWGN